MTGTSAKLALDVARNAVRRVGGVTRERILRAYIVALTLVAVGWLILERYPADLAHWAPTFLLLTIMGAGLEFVGVPLAKGGTLSVATIPHVAAILLLPPPLAALSVGVALSVEEVVHRTGLDKAAFNVASFVLTALIASHAAGLLANLWVDVPAAPRNHVGILLALGVAGALYYIVNAVLLCVVLALATGERFWWLLRANTRDTGLSEMGGATIGGLFGLLWVIDPFWTPLLVLPGAVIGRSLQHIRSLQSETRFAIRALANIIDHRDATTFQHSARVATYARSLSVELGLDEDTSDLIEEAAAVHDLGKIGVPDRVLLKSGPLDPLEQRMMWRHTVIGAVILGHFQLFRKGSAIVRYHHEAYDGSGYPSGLVGDAIPMGARVVAVADAFDAMTSHRPYRSALTEDEAVRRLRAGAGTQWDPVIVGVFLRLVMEGRLPLPDPHLHLGDAELGDMVNDTLQSQRSTERPRPKQVAVGHARRRRRSAVAERQPVEDSVGSVRI